MVYRVAWHFGGGEAGGGWSWWVGEEVGDEEADGDGRWVLVVGCSVI